MKNSRFKNYNSINRNLSSIRVNQNFLYAILFMYYEVIYLNHKLSFHSIQVKHILPYLIRLICYSEHSKYHSIIPYKRFTQHFLVQLQYWLPHYSSSDEEIASYSFFYNILQCFSMFLTSKNFRFIYIILFVHWFLRISFCYLINFCQFFFRLFLALPNFY